MSAYDRYVFIKTKLIGFKVNNEFIFCYFFVINVFENSFQDANIVIVNGRSRGFLPDTVCVIIKSAFENTVYLSNMLGFWALLTMKWIP